MLRNYWRQSNYCSRSGPKEAPTFHPDYRYHAFLESNMKWNVAIMGHLDVDHD